MKRVKVQILLRLYVLNRVTKLYNFELFGKFCILFWTSQLTQSHVLTYLICFYVGVIQPTSRDSFITVLVLKEIFI